LVATPPFVIEKLFRRLALINRFLKAAVDEIFSLLTYSNLAIELMLFIHYNIKQASNSSAIIFAWVVRPLIIEKVVSYYPQRPHIAFLVVLLSLQDLWSHCHGRPNEALHPTIREILGEAEVSKL
jgi:hypothetical protein